MSTVYTIGHSAHTWEEFAGLLAGHQVNVIVDARSAPYSRFAPQFDREVMQRKLTESGIKYIFLGAELGGRPTDPAYYDKNGHVLYGRMKSDPAFMKGIERLERGIAPFRVALLCGEEDPAHCHRRLLVGRVLAEHGHELLHIRADGRLQTDAQVTAESGKPLETGNLPCLPNWTRTNGDLQHRFHAKKCRRVLRRTESRGIERLLDVRLNNTSQLAGFASNPISITFLRRSVALRTSVSRSSRPHRKFLTYSKNKKGVGKPTRRPILR